MPDYPHQRKPWFISVFFLEFLFSFYPIACPVEKTHSLQQLLLMRYQVGGHRLPTPGHTECNPVFLKRRAAGQCSCTWAPQISGVVPVTAAWAPSPGTKASFPVLGQLQSTSSLSSELNVKTALSCPTPCDSMDCSPPGTSVHEFSRQEYWSGLLFPSPQFGGWSPEGSTGSDPSSREQVRSLSALLGLYL